MRSIGWRLEQYTIKRPQEVLLVTIELPGLEDAASPESDSTGSNQIDQIAIFKGFSSSLIRSTAFDPDIPMIPEQAVIVAIDRLASPYHPDRPHYLQRELSLADMEVLLREVGI